MRAIANISAKTDVNITKNHEYEISTYVDKYENITYVFFDDEGRFSTINEDLFSTLFIDIVDIREQKIDKILDKSF